MENWGCQMCNHSPCRWFITFSCRPGLKLQTCSITLQTLMLHYSNCWHWQTTMPTMPNVKKILFKCRRCNQLARSPVILECGTTFCRTCLTIVQQGEILQDHACDGHNVNMTCGIQSQDRIKLKCVLCHRSFQFNRIQAHMQRAHQNVFNFLII